MTTNWMRKCSLIVANDAGEGLELSGLKISFNISRPDISYPATAMFKIYNLSRNTNSRIRQNEFTQIKFVAGYQDNFGLIFSGQIQYSYSGRENPTDTYVVIQAADSDQAHNFAVMNTTLAAGYTQQDVHTALMKPIGVYDIVAGATPEFATTKAPRGKPMFGMHRDEVSSLAAQCKATWRYENGRLQMVPENAYLADAIVLNAQTGLIGMPEQTINGGINVKCLINPNIQLDTLIRLDNKSINQVGLSNQEIATGSTAGASVQQPAVLDMDGDYIVKNIAYYGDTRGNTWYQDMICIAKGGAGLLNQSTIRAGA
ncbi:phage protein [Serratia marcescens]|uniref:phage protein n=1 Tax=Serratia marcescens TaxID=615 RepID=UPI001C948452|nr:hypothetical protein [Serratia marcescens]MBY4847827.1 hypothetical protein [Serratia marcescens]MCH9865834.1 hypothetical protein [Serratia marcescens]